MSAGDVSFPTADGRLERLFQAMRMLALAEASRGWPRGLVMTREYVLREKDRLRAELSFDSADGATRQFAAHAEYMLWLRSLGYGDYLRTFDWLSARVFALDRADWRCQICDGESGLQVHHRAYQGIGCERLSDLAVLCAECHRLFHENRRLATASSVELAGPDRRTTPQP